MYILLIICAFIFLLAIIMLITPVKAIVNLKKDSDKALFRYKVTVAGITVFTNKSKANKNNDEYTKSKDSAGKKIKIADAIDIYREFSDKITELVHYTANHSLKFEKIHLSLVFGTGDAAITGVTYGAVSGIVYSTLGIIDSKCTIKDNSIEITPDFFNSVFNLDCECIVRLRNVHIIVIAFKFLLLMLKIRKTSSDNKIINNTNK